MGAWRAPWIIGAVFERFDLEAALAHTARVSGVALDARAITLLAAHARAVAEANARLHLTSIVDPELFVRRHVGEALAGVALVDPARTGTLVDLGSGNGFPGIPFAVARPRLRLVMVDASSRRAAFLRELVGRLGLSDATVVEANVQRADDLAAVGPVAVLTCRALGGWARLLPKLARCLASDGRVLLWAGDDVEGIARRTAWRRLRLVSRHRLEGMERAFVYEFAAAAGD